MPHYKIAHVREQGVDLIIIPLDFSFGRKVASDQRAVVVEFQLRAQAAGLAGTVVPVWDNGGGRIAFMAPRNWHAFFESINPIWIQANLNRELYW